MLLNIQQEVNKIKLLKNKDEIRSKRKELRQMRLSYKNTLKENERINNKKTLEELDIEINDFKSKLIKASSDKKLNNHERVEVIKNIEYDIALLNVEKFKLQDDFLIRNMIKTSICNTVKKGKECKFEGCTFAHDAKEIRKPLCVYNVFNICEYGNDCKHDHNSKNIPELPLESKSMSKELSSMIKINLDMNNNEYKYVLEYKSLKFYFNEKYKCLITLLDENP